MSWNNGNAIMIESYHCVPEQVQTKHWSMYFLPAYGSPALARFGRRYVRHDHLCRNVRTWPHDAVTELLLSIANNALDLGVHVAKVDSPSPVELQ